VLGASHPGTDPNHMRHALVLAERALGQTAPNPAVGCVIVAQTGVIVGRGWTARGGRPHAETQALLQAGEAARGATAYVTLEPCSHVGMTPPCADALISAGIARVVVAVEDPDPRVNGRGVARLRAAGVEVITGFCEAEAARVNAGFFLKVRENRPLVTLKIAQSSDGFTATTPGASRWITSEQSRAFGHLMRARNDAILVGIETVLYDDPMLDCRLPGMEDRSPLRVVLDSRLRLPVDSELSLTAKSIPTVVFTSAATGGEDLALMRVKVVRLGSAPRPGLDAVLRELAGWGITRLLVEGGATVHAAFLAAGLVDRIELFTSPVRLGASGRGMVAGLVALTLGEAPRFQVTRQRSIGPDLLVSYARGD
jgi:diaminohydroxyphosphoribosylaminopyrimidine deaminase / 5-amino-6-(5-phosphoribosylamino)uracil reductase